MKDEAGVRPAIRAAAGVLLASVQLCMAAEQSPAPRDSGETGWWKPYSPPCVERENAFEFAEKPAVKKTGNDRYEIAFAVKAYCDVTVSIVDPAGELVKGRGTVVRHLASGVLGPNAPAPFQKNSLKQTILWNGKDDLDEYAKKPEALRVRVSLGLKPEFDKLLGTGTPYNLPGYVDGVATSPEGVFVFVRGIDSRCHCTIRQYDHDGRYVKTIFPPPADLPAEKLGGLWWVEYEPGRRSLIGTSIDPDNVGRSNWLPYGVERGGPCLHRPFVIGDRLFFGSSGFDPPDWSKKICRPALHWVHTDGSTDVRGLEGRKYYETRRHSLVPRLAPSPDGRRVYMTGLDSDGISAMRPVVLRFSLDGDEPAEVFAGDMKEQGGADGRLNGPCDVDCDGAGRVYVADRLNNRIAIFSEDGKPLKAVAVDAPVGVQVHRKTGAIYVVQALSATRGGGEGVFRIVKFKGYPDCGEEFGWGEPLFPDLWKDLGREDQRTGPIFTLDSWSDRPRLWMAMAIGRLPGGVTAADAGLWEEGDGRWTKVLSFNERAMSEAGARYPGRWLGSCSGDAHVTCDPLTEQVYLRRHQIFDLRTGDLLGRVPDVRNSRPTAFLHQGPGTGLAFDKRGYAHIEYAYSHVGRVEPTRQSGASPTERWQQAEVPYDYGEGVAPWTGALALVPVGRHPCGIGVNMRGDVANVLNAEVTPKFDDTVEFYNANVLAGTRAWGNSGASWQNDLHGRFVRDVQEMEKRGMEMYYVRREPGVPVGGGTVWTWGRTGEVWEKGAVVAGHRINGVQIDEDRNLYFSNCRFRMRGGQPFLAGRAGRYGTSDTTTLFTGTYMKTRGTKVRFRCADAPIPIDQAPEREPDLSGPWLGGDSTDVPVWVEGAEWLYAGASPMKPNACMCPQIRTHLDWYKRSYVPEYYRHSIGVLDAAGNLILHVGRYGNFDSGAGADSRIKVGGDEIASTSIRHVSGTDNYLVFSDWEQRLVCLRLDYCAEEEAEIGAGPPR